MRRDRPNILFLMTDQHRFDCLGCMGHPLVQTPQIDGLASNGTLFTNAYTPSPVCAPARAALFSGQYPPGCGVVTNWAPFNGMEVLLPEHLQHAGYVTAAVGKLHFVPHLKRFGFAYKRLHDAPFNVYADDARYSEYIRFLQATLYRDDPEEPVRRFDDDERQYPDGDLKRFILGSNFLPESHHMTTWTADESIRFLETVDQEKPFFLFASFFGPHQPYDPPDPWRAHYDLADVELPSQFDADMSDRPIFTARKARTVSRLRSQISRDEYRRILAAYYGNITMIDHHIGRLLAALRSRGLWDNTLIVFCADHGDHAGQYGLFFKGDMYEPAVHVPLMIKPAGAPTPGRRCDRVVNTLDLYGTLLDAAGHALWEVDGIESGSLLDLLGSDAAGTDPGETYSIHGEDPHNNLTMLRRGHFKLMRLARGPTEALYEMYDLRDGTWDVRDVFNDARYRGAREDLRASLDTWWRRQASRYPPEVRCLNKKGT